MLGAGYHDRHVRRGSLLTEPGSVARLALVIFVCAVAGWAVLIPPDAPVSIVGLCLYGTRARSIVPFALGMTALSACCLRIGWLLHSTRRRLAAAMAGVAACVVAILVTPYTVSGTVNAVHVSFGTTLFVLQLGIVGDLLDWPPTPGTWPLLVGVAAGDLLAFAGLTLNWPTMWTGQVISQIAFLALLATVDLRTTARGSPARR
jgi:hypothetical protein